MAIVIGIVIDDDIVSYMGVRSYRIHRTQTTSVEVLTKPPPQPQRQSSRRGLFDRIKGFASWLRPDGLVPSSPKVQSEVLYAEQSPWMQQVRNPEVVEDVEQIRRKQQRWNSAIYVSPSSIYAPIGRPIGSLAS